MIRSKKSLIISLLLVTGVLVLINILSDRFFVRLDLTEDKRYTLSNATRDILNDLDEPVTVTAYFSKDIGTEIENLRRDFKDMLTEYASVSDGMLVYEFINPNESEEIENEAMQAGILPLQVQTREKDQLKVQRAFLGAVIQLGEDEDVIPVMHSTEGMEYALSTAIKKLTVSDKPLVALLQGHGEPGLSQLQQVAQQITILNNVQPVWLNDSTSALANYDALAIVAPKDSFALWELQQLDEFLNSGKNVFVAINRVEAELQQSMGYAVTTGLETWLGNKGININPNFVMDENSGSVNVQIQPGFFMPIPFPYLPIAVNFNEHPVSKGLEQVIFQFVSSINYTGDTAVAFTPLVLSSETSATEGAPVFFNVQREYTQADFPLENLTLGAAFEGPIGGAANAKMVVIGDGDFVVGEANGRGQINPDNISLMANAIDWLTDDTGLIELRTKGATARPIDELEDSRRTFLKYMNFLLPIIIIIVYGVIRFQVNQSMRVKRMEVDYV